MSKKTSKARKHVLRARRIAFDAVCVPPPGGPRETFNVGWNAAIVYMSELMVGAFGGDGAAVVEKVEDFIGRDDDAAS